MNGKADVTSERWPSLLSLTCQGSSGSGSGSDLSLSRACSEYSSGSYTWAEGHGCSKQVTTVVIYLFICLFIFESLKCLFYLSTFINDNKYNSLL